MASIYAHFLNILRDLLPELDRVVWSELPGPVLQPRLMAIVTRYMIHGPYGIAKRSALCLLDRKCLKRFTKRFQ